MSEVEEIKEQIKELTDEIKLVNKQLAFIVRKLYKINSFVMEDYVKEKYAKLAKDEERK